MKIDQTRIEELKSAHTEGIFEGEINFTDSEDKQHKVVFIYRKPSTADMEAHVTSGIKNPVVANLNLIQSLIVHPEPVEIIEKIRDYPMTLGRFVDEAIAPFFGANVQIKRRKL